jgi:CRISPR-associated protein Csc1
MGTLYETERYIHNYALSYALFNDSIIKVPYFCASYRPTYADDLGKLTERGIYVTPARPVHVSFMLTTWKMGQVTYHRNPEKFGGRNYPMNYGRAKEISPESEFEFFVINREPVTLPRWVRLGKWASKALVEPEKSVQVDVKNGPFTSASPLNPLDVPHSLTVYDLISMPPVSLVNNARLNGEHYELDEKTKIPSGMKYTFPP